MSLLCSIKNIQLTYGTKAIFKNAQLSISTGDRIGLLGLNGKGKSTLFKILSGEVVPDHCTPPFEFNKARGDGDDSKRFTMFYIPQELPVSGLEDVTIRDYFFVFYPELKDHYENALDEFERLHGWDLLQDYESYLKYFNHDDLDKKIGELSGGEQKKILLSLGLSSNANLILWDEPTNHLDIETIKLFEDELNSTNKAFMLITHDRYLLSKLTRRILHIQHGKIENFDGSYTDYLVFLEQSEHAKQSLLTKLKNNLEREQAWMRQGVKARRTRSKKRVEDFLDLKDKVSHIKSEAKKTLDLTLQKSNRQTKVLVSFTDLYFQYNKENTLFEGITGEIHKGNKIGLLGSNGVGKTTLLKLIKADLKPTSGIMKTAENLQIQYFSQKRDELDIDMTPYQLLGDGNDFVALPDGSKKHVHSYFESFLFGRDDIHRPLKTFSGGEKSRLQLAYNLTRIGDILIFDEPTNDLDLETIQILEEKLAEFPGAVILISHDRAFLSTVTNKVWLLDEKKLQNFEGGYEQVAPYIDALEIEKDLRKNEAPQAPLAPPVEAVISKPVQSKNKQKIDNLISEIEANELKSKIIQEKIAGLDYTKLSDPKNAEFKILSDAQSTLEERALSLYQELEELEK
ncbi:MAG: ABC-F family ATP-binding cassette domain-containing protein [Bacteriovoracaceae bacterium]|nr:ABC-F family ATP-binding cassette domain-containing protein [Bacteriovoracaceae bacterium]